MVFLYREMILLFMKSTVAALQQPLSYGEASFSQYKKRGI